MRLEVGLSISRFCVVAGIHRATWHRRGARARERRESRWPAPERDRIEQPVARLALAGVGAPQDLGAFASRRAASRITSHRPASAAAPRTDPAARRAARAARARPSAPRGVHRARPAPQPRLAVRLSEFETAGGGTWNLGGLVDYHGKLALTCPVSATKTHRDAIAALEVARDRVSDLLGRPLAEGCVDPTPASWSR